ncbi:MAG TPA: cob(I)yrinic acid a,c-diamide adenosyltransferase [Nitrolancea sp.]|jgi:cob(I)alamin adenosyltransferase|nr:cob(I)yrinic acid a,c-diamide adenosyltransferase [Nitrolancea sp.]
MINTTNSNDQEDLHGYLMLLVGDERATSDAALGIALRGAGHNLRVHIIEFQKTGRDRGEVIATSFLTGVSLSQYGTTEANQTVSETGGVGTSPERTEAALRDARSHVNRRVTNILILEGILSLIDNGLVDESVLLELAESAAPWLDIVATGSAASDRLRDHADSVTTMVTTKAQSRDAELRPGIHY